MLLRVLVVPFNAMAILARKFVKFSSFFLDVFHKLLDGTILFGGLEDIFVEALNLFNEELYLIILALEVIHLHAQVFHFDCFLPELQDQIGTHLEVVVLRLKIGSPLSFINFGLQRV